MMNIRSEVRPQLAKTVWKPFQIRTGLRQLRELRTGYRERRGRRKRYDDQDFIRFYIEVEARARLHPGGFVLAVLQHPKLRLVASDGRSSRLNRQDIQRLRQQHAEGQREALAWHNTKFMGRPHPRWSDIQRRIEQRETQLRSSAKGELFFLKKM